MLISLFFLACSFLFGLLIAKHLAILEDWWKKAAFAAGFGLLVSTWLVFLFSFAMGSLTIMSISIPCVLLLGAFLKFFKLPKHMAKIDLQGLLFTLFVLLILIFLNFRILPHFADDGKMVAGANVWGDYPFHLGLIHSFSDGANFPPKYPILVTANLAYPFMVDFLSAILLKGGMGLFDSLIIPHAIFYFAMISFLYFLGTALSRRKLVGALLVLLFIFNGNWGAYYAFSDAFQSPDPMGFLLHPPKAFSHIDPIPPSHIGTDNIEFMNQLLSVFIPQRSAIMGIPLLVIFIFFLFSSIKGRDRKNLLASGIILGLLPLVHAHSFLIACAIAPFAFAYSLYHSPDKKAAFKDWLFLIVPALVLSIPQMLFMSGQLGGAEFMKYRVGWMQGDGASIPDVLVFWLRNLGVILPLALAGFFLSSKPIRFLFIPVLLVFAAGNLYQLAPWDWDTIKVFNGFFLFSCYFAAVALEKLISGRRKAIRILGILLLAFAMFSGVISLFWWYGDQPALYSSRDFVLADWVKENTQPNAVWITSDAHTHIIPTLTGRQTVLGLKWYLYSHGLEKKKLPVERDIQRFFHTADCSIAEKYGATYLFLGVQEESIEKADRALFTDNPEYVPILDVTLDRYRTTIFKIECGNK
ncbi:MAG: hypothetical protein ABH863_04475 [Candidatus Micrarchaeota archaeon]